MDLSLRGIVGQRYGLTNGFSVTYVLSRAKNDIGKDFYTITSGVSVRFLLTTLVGTLTQHHNNRRTGGYLNEVLLTTSSIPQRFGKLFELPLDGQIEGQIFAQPLFLPNVNIPNQGTHDVLYVATMHNTVYAFVVDTNPPYTLWSKQLVPSIFPLPDPLIGPTDYDIEIGIISTPVISLPHNALYVVTTTNDKSTGGYNHFLHALDLVTNKEKFGGPVVIGGSVMGTGTGSQNGTIHFISFWQNQRPALLLANDMVYIAFASYMDRHPYHGWVFAYNAATLQHTAVFNTTPQSRRGGIWQSGQGLASDGDGNVYFMTGNSYTKADPDYRNDPPNASVLHDSFVKLHPDLTLADWFSPHNSVKLSKHDRDLGSGGVLLIPDSFLALGGGKEGKFYLVDTQGMGNFNPHNDNQIVQPPFSVGNQIWGGPVYWNGSNHPCVYVWPTNDVIKAFRLIFGLFQTTPVLRGKIKSGENIGVLSLSADGSTPGSGILWASYEDKGGQGVLLAMDASSLTPILWNSAKNPLDNVGLWAKWCPPTVANGRVYMASFSGHIAVYGLKGP
jgi:hypothetical protein